MQPEVENKYNKQHIIYIIIVKLKHRDNHIWDSKKQII